ncbi:MAG: LapA family protein [Candidatus Stahlbacteria bacterium]|nr:LapA family protein [Candidatus Stahlbacteria bacterium]
MYLFAIIIIVLFALLGIIFGAQNSHQVAWHFLGKDSNTPLISVIIISFGCGVVLAFILAIVDEFKLRGNINKQQKEIDALKRELGTLKTMTTQEEKE